MTASACRPPPWSLSRKTRWGLTPPVSPERTLPTMMRACATRHAGGPHRLLKPTSPVAPGSGAETPSPSSTGPTGPTRREGEQQDSRDCPFFCSFSLSLLCVSEPLPLAYKREGKPLVRERLTHSHEHFATRKLGALSLSRPFVTPTASKCKNMSSLNWT
jgi:hypothetical protein